MCVPAGDVANDPPVGCGGKSDGDRCSDGDACTENDACRAGACVGTAKRCGGDQVCSAGVCVDLGACTLTGAVQRVTTTSSASEPALAYDGDRDRLALVYVDATSGIDELWFQLLDDRGVSQGPAVQLTHGEPADQNDVQHPSEQPSLVYNPDQKEFGVAFSRGGLIFDFDMTSMTVTANGVPAPSHQLALGENSVSPQIAWTGVTYGAAWINGLVDADTNENVSVVEFAALHDDGSKISFSNKTLSQEGAGDACALAFDPRTASFAVAYPLDGPPASLVVTTTNVDGDAAVDTPIAGAGSPRQPAIAVVPGGIAVVWQDDPGGTGLGALDFAVVSDGLVASTPRTVTDDGEQCGRPSLAATPAGLALAYAATNASGVLEVRLRLLADDGTPGPARVVTAGQRPAAAALPAGVAVVDVQVSADQSTSDLYAASSCLTP